MDQKNLLKIWDGVALVLLYLTINIWSQTQGWRIKVAEVISINAESYVASFYGIILCAPLFILLLVLTRLYAMRSEGATWAERLPAPFIDVNTHSKSGRYYQGFILFIFLIIPAAGQIHFANKFLDGTAYHVDTDEEIVGSKHLTRYTSLAEAFDRKFFYGDKNKKKSIDYVPFWMGAFFCVIWLISIILFVVTITTIFFKATFFFDKNN